MSLQSKRQSPWLVCILPFAVYMLMLSFEPKPSPADGGDPPSQFLDLGIQYEHYPIVYTVKILLVIATMAFVWPGYRQYTRRFTAWGVAIGVVGAAVWIALAHLQASVTSGWNKSLLDWFGQRSAFDPLTEMADTPSLAYGFLAIRFLGLVLVVPIIEEFFLRGFLMRFVQQEKWWDVPFGDVTPLAVAAGTLVPMLSHTSELLAALVWFSAVTWLMVRTRSIWDCILAHAITNLLLGIYVVTQDQWWLM